MAPRSRYAVDPSLSTGAQQQPQDSWGQQQGSQYGQQAQYGQQQQQQQPEPSYLVPGHQHDQQYGHHQQPYVNPAGPQLHNVSDRREPAPTGPYAPTPQQQQQQQQQYHATQQQQQQQQQPPHHYNYPPANHIQQPPHSYGPQLTGPRIRIDPSQVPDPIEMQEMDQNLYDDEDFHSCDTKGLIPLAVTDFRGVDQGNSLPRHLRITTTNIPATAALLDTSALPLGIIVQPFAPLRYDEAPVPLVTNWVAGESAFDIPQAATGEEEGPPRCDKCRGYINPWVRFTDGGRRWQCNLCGGQSSVPAAYFTHLAHTGQRMDMQDRPELLHGTVDFAVPKQYWAEQPKGSILEAEDLTAATLAGAGDALATTGSDLLGALHSSLGGNTPTRGNTPAPGHKARSPAPGGRRLRRPAPLGRVFVIDVSAPSVHRGVVRSVCEGIRTALFGSKRATEGEDEGEGEGDDQSEDEDVIGEGERVGFVTIGQTAGFWNVSPALDQPQLLVVSDLDDMFCPLATGLLVDPRAARSQIEALLALLPDMYERQPDGTGCAVGAAIKGTLDGLRSLGGQINVFLSGLPQLGPGRLKIREETGLSGTDKEKTLFHPADPFWIQTGEELAMAGIGVNMFTFPDQATDIATIGTVSTITGGETFFHPKFNPVRDGPVLAGEIKRVVVRETAYNATVRVRCSNGLRVAEHNGNYYQHSLTDLEFGNLDESKAFAASIRHEGSRLDDRQTAYIQVATLYTSANGERRVRCLNMSLPVSGLIGNVFRFADLDTVVAFFYKYAVTQLPERRLRDIRRALIERCNRVLLMYRKHCAPSVPAGQLILPEGFKLLPLYTLCMVKQKALKGGNVVADVRSHYARGARGAGASAIMTALYPRMVAVHDLAESVGFPGANGRLQLPRFQRLSYNYMVPDGAYLLDNGETCMLWLGTSVNPQILMDLYGVENLDELDTRVTRLPKLPTLLSTQVRNLVTHLERLTGHALPVLPVRQERDGMEIEFANALLEDRNNDQLSYADFLPTAHKWVTNELSGKSDGWKAPWS